MNKKIIAAMVGVGVASLLILSGALYAVATTDVPDAELPETDEPEEEEADADEADADEDEATEEETDGEAEEEEEEEQVDVSDMSVECEIDERGEPELRSVHSRADADLNVSQTEADIHNSLNDLREAQSGLDPLVCDEEMRELARQQSEFIFEEMTTDEDGEPSEYWERMDEYPHTLPIYVEGDEGLREIGEEFEPGYGEVCHDSERIEERHGAWAYQRNIDVTWAPRDITQRLQFADRQEELVRDVRGVTYNGENQRMFNALTDENVTRQGIGVHIHRNSGLTIVTQVVC